MPARRQSSPRVSCPAWPPPFDFYAELLPITAFVIYHRHAVFSIQKRRFVWEQREFFSYAQRRSEISAEATLPRIEYEDIIPDQGVLNKDIFQKESMKKGIRFSKGDVLFGKLRPYLKNWFLPCFSGLAVGDFWVLYAKQGDSAFLYYLLQTPDFFFISNQSSGSKMPRADWSLVSQNKFSFPSEKTEQEKIGQFFKSLDRLITLHQRVYFQERTDQTINGHTKTDSWEQRELGEIAPITMGQSPDGCTYSDTPSTYILVQGNADLKDGWVVPRIWTSQATKQAPAGALIMSVRAPAGAMGKTAYNVVLGRGVAAINGSEFLYQVLVKMDADGYWKKLSCGSTFESLNSDTINAAQITVPSDHEQQKIGSLFQRLDCLITLHQREYLLFEVLLC